MAELSWVQHFLINHQLFHTEYMLVALFQELNMHSSINPFSP